MKSDHQLKNEDKKMTNGNFEPSPNIYSVPPPPPPPPAPYYEEALVPKPKGKKIKIIIGVLLFFVIITLVVSASVYFYQKNIGKDPISLLPADTSFYIRIQTNPESQQVKNFKDLLNKFPYYTTISGKMNEFLDFIKEQEPAFKNFDFTIANELIISFVSQLDVNTNEAPFVFIFPNPDLKKIDKLSKDFQDEMEKNKDWEIEKEVYKDRTIIKAVPIKKPQPEGNYKYYTPPEPTERPSFVLTNDHFFFSLKPEYLKKIIDVAEDQKIINIFKKNKKESIVSGMNHEKIIKYIPKDYLILTYGEFDFAEFFQKSGNIVKKDEIKTNPFIASLALILNSLSLDKKDDVKSEQVSFAGVVIAKNDELQFESYSLNLREDAFLPSQFSISSSLAKFIPEKINDEGISLYGEGSNLENIFNYLEDTITKEMDQEAKEDYDKSWKELKEILGIDLKKDIIPLLNKNYAFFVASEPTGQKIARAGFIFEVDDENKIKENILKIKIPYEPSIFNFGLGSARSKAKDARIQADLSQLRAIAEIIYDDEGSYLNLKCNNSEVNTICQDIESQIGINPVIYQSKDKYCAYSKLNQEGYYYCIDSKGSYIKTFVAPNYCKSTSLSCPSFSGSPPEKFLSSVESLGFSKEIIDGFEVYSMAVSDDIGLYFSIKDKKLILTFSKKAIVDILQVLTSSSQNKLANSVLFSEHLKEAPDNIYSISYANPYEFLGVIKSGLIFYINLMVTKEGKANLEPTPEFMISKLSEFFDRGITPYAKLINSYGEYSYSPEKGLLINKGRLIFKDLSSEEKKSTEDFWDNFPQWMEEIEAESNRDGRIKTDLSQARMTAKMIYEKSDFSSYENLCTEPPAKKFNRNDPDYGSNLATLEDDIKKRQGGVLDLSCLDSASSFCIVAGLNSGSKYCVDSSNSMKVLPKNQTCVGSGTAQDGYRCPGATIQPSLNQSAEYQLFNKEISYRGSSSPGNEEISHLPTKLLYIPSTTKIQKIEATMEAYNHDPEYPRSAGIAVGYQIPDDCKSAFYIPSINPNSTVKKSFELSPGLFRKDINQITTWISTYKEWGGDQSWVSLKIKIYYTGEKPKILEEGTHVIEKSIDPINCKLK